MVRLTFHLVKIQTAFFFITYIILNISHSKLVEWIFIVHSIFSDACNQDIKKKQFVMGIYEDEIFLKCFDFPLWLSLWNCSLSVFAL